MVLDALISKLKELHKTSELSSRGMNDLIDILDSISIEEKRQRKEVV
jgi:hypothetical protein